MYINKIDELIDKIIDDFYNNVILKNKEFNKILQEANFVKYQGDINKILSSYEKTINKKEIYDIIHIEENVSTIVEIIKKYLAFYIFLTIGIFYKGKRETFINNIVEFSKNQTSFNYKINNFFNSESNSAVIRFSTIIRNIITLLESDSHKRETLEKRDDYADTVNFLKNQVGEDEKYFRLENLNNNAKDQAHNIIKFLIIIELYLGADKVEVHQILDETQKEAGEYIYIDIIVPKTDFVDYSSIESVLSKKEVEMGLANDLYEMIIQSDDPERSTELTTDDKILALINNKIITPISEDFLLYHKDSEKYEKVMTQTVKVTSKFTGKKSKKEKDDTKIRYIVSRIDGISEYYSDSVAKNPELKKNIEKNFYAPLSDRMATLVNNIEELQIINKLINQGRTSIDSNEYYNDLLNYRQYPYINFKDFKTYGFSLILDKTINVVRNVNFSDEANINKPVQLRVGSEDQTLNIVGFVIPTNELPLDCLFVKNFTDIRNLNYKDKHGNKIKYDNGYKAILKFIKHSILSINKKTKKIHPAVYWLFNLETDKIKMTKYEQAAKFNNQEHLKLMVSKLYDDILTNIFNILRNLFGNFAHVTLYKFYQVIRHISKNFISIDAENNTTNRQITKLYDALNDLVTFEKYYKTIDEYDKREDKFPGLYGNVIKLPSMPKQKKSPHVIYAINLEEIKDTQNKKQAQSKSLEIQEIKNESLIDETEYSKISYTNPEGRGALCQHNVTWDNLTELRKKNPNKFTELLIEFIYRYVISNDEDDFICKSCGTQINLKKYVNDGSYDDEGRYITFSTPMQVPIEDIPEYEKYKPAIRSIDKIIERIASICNIFTLVEKSTRVRNPTKLRLIKDCVDLNLIHNKNLDPIYKERNKKITSLYGIDKELSNLFIFELDNSIFVYSSKDKDYYKDLKRNNILVYIIFLAIIELTDSQVIYMGGDKLCNYLLFTKFGLKLFEGLKIITNNNRVTMPITEFKVLCYLIFYISCMVTKYNMWYLTEEKPTSGPRKFNPLVQKIIIHTLVDLINSILEIDAVNPNDPDSNLNKKGKPHYLYNIISVKFFQKLNSTFSNQTVLDKLKIIQESKIVTEGEKHKYRSATIKPIILAPDYGPITYTGINVWQTCKIVKYFILLKTRIFRKYTAISNVTNCELGTFHKWTIVKGNTLQCAICNKLLNEITLDSDLSEKILVKYNYNLLRKHSEKYCKSGNFHKYIYDITKKCNVCETCQFTNPDQLTNQDLDELKTNINNMKEKEKHDRKKQKDLQDVKDTKKLDKANKTISILKSQYGKTKSHKEDFYNFINDFVEQLGSIISKNININNEDVFLKEDVYVIGHDHNGYSLPKPFVIKEEENRIQYKKNHPFFKTDVLYYTNNKLQIDVFYDAMTLLLLGYKERNKDFQNAKQKNVFLKINYSIMNRLKMLGYPSKYIEISDKLNKYSKEYVNIKEEATQQNILKLILADISRNRIQNLKKAITDIQRFLYRIKYNYETKPGIDNPDKFLEQYMNVLGSKIKLKDAENKNKIFSNWKAVKYELFFQELSNKLVNLSFDSKYLLTDDISFYDYHGNIILYYIISELRKLLDYNPDKFFKQKIAFLMIDMINKIYNNFNEENFKKNFEIKRFQYIINSKAYIYDVEQKGHGLEGELEGFYGEYKDPDDPEDPDQVERIESDKEEFDALDVDGDLDYEIDYLSGVNLD